MTRPSLVALSLCAAAAAAAVPSCGGDDASPGATPSDGGTPTVDGQSGDASADGPVADASAGDGDATASSCPVLPLIGVGPFSLAWATRVSNNEDTIAAVKADASGNVVWERTLAGKKTDAGSNSYVLPSAILPDGSGGAIVVGSFLRVVDFAGDVRAAGDAGNQTANALFVMALSSTGTTTLLRTYDAVGTGVTAATFDAAGKLWIAGVFPAFIGTPTSTPVNFGGGDLPQHGGRDVYVLELDPATGDHLFSASYGSSGNDDLAGIAPRPAATGGTVLAGLLASSSGTLGGASAASSGSFVAAYTAAGAYDWSVFPTSLGGTINDVTTAANGDVFLVGTQHIARFGPTGTAGFVTTFDAMFSLGSIAVDASGKLAAAGSVSSGSSSLAGMTFTVSSPPGAPGRMGVVVRLDANGQATSARAYGGGCSKFDNSTGGENSRGSAVAFDATGRLLVGAGIAGNVDLGTGTGPVLRNTRQATVLAVAP